MFLDRYVFFPSALCAHHVPHVVHKWSQNLFGLMHFGRMVVFTPFHAHLAFHGDLGQTCNRPDHLVDLPL